MPLVIEIFRQAIANPMQFPVATFLALAIATVGAFALVSLAHSIADAVRFIRNNL